MLLIRLVCENRTLLLFFFNHKLNFLVYLGGCCRTLLFLYPNVKSIRKEKYFFITAQKHTKNNIVSI